MIIDPHIHSIYSGDATGTPKQIINQAIEVGLDGIAIADHNTIKGSILAQEESKNLDNFVLIPAIEISSTKGHIVALGIVEEIKSGLSPQKTVEKIRENGGIAVVPHPFVKYRQGLYGATNDLDFDAIETLNSRYIFGYSNWQAKRLAKKRKIPEIGCSDAHFLGAIGSCVTELEADFSVESIIDGIMKRKTNVFGNRTPLPLILKEVIKKKIKRT
jgi:predicted metal-dependent phosphoesterase TrpH